MGDAPSPSADGDVLTLGVAGERFAIPVGEVREIVRPGDMTRVPLSPPSLLGLANLRGTVLPVVSLTGLLGHEAGSPTPAARVVVVNNGPVGLLVDAVYALTSKAEVKRLDIDTLLKRDFSALTRRSAVATPVPRILPAGVAQTPTQTLAVIGFLVGEQEYALPLDKVLEVAPLPPGMAAVPSTDRAMMGLITFRGTLLPLVSLRALLGLPDQDLDYDKARFIVTRIGTIVAGLVVGGLTAVLRVPEDAIDPVPAVLTRGAGEARIEGIARLENGRRLVSILSPARLFDAGTAARLHADVEQGSRRMVSQQNASDAVEQFVIFQLGSDHFGLPIAAVDEVVRRPDRLTRVPHAPPFVEGVMNLRGRIVPVIDQGRRFAVDAGAGTRGRRVVIVTIGTLQAGFAVDGVSEVLSVPASELAAAPVLTADSAAVFDRVVTLEREGRMILLVDPKVLLSHAERDVLATIAEAAAASP